MRARTLLSLPLLATFLVTAAAGRSRPPSSPPPGPVPRSILALDDDVVRPALPGPPPPGVDLRDSRDGLRRSGAPANTPEARKVRLDAVKSSLPEIGGDDVTVRTGDGFDGRMGVAVTSTGVIFVALAWDDPDILGEEYTEVWRSTDGGTSFSLWGSINSPGAVVERFEDLDLAEGVVSRLYVTYQYYNGSGFEVKVAWADPTAASASWTTVTAMAGAGLSFLNPRLCTDVDVYDDFYMYLACAAIDGNGDDIWFARSTSYGETWSSAYRIAQLTSSGNLMYSLPRISYGYDGVVHVMFMYTERLQSTFDDAIRYIRALNDATSPADWQAGPLAITSSSDGIDQYSLDIQASVDDMSVVLTHTSGYNQIDPLIRASTDEGYSWPPSNGVAAPWDHNSDILYRPSTGEFLFGGFKVSDTPSGYELVLCRSSSSSPLSLGPLSRFSDFPRDYGYGLSLALDPTHGDRVAAGSEHGYLYQPSDVLFDGEWRGDPGYPNYEDGYPLPLAAGAVSPPGLANLDDDGELEIFFGDAAENLQAFDPDGTPLPGFPVHVGAPLSDGPVACGVLDMTDEPSLVVGTADGRVFAYDTSGNLRPGFPYSMPETAPVYVSIGALGGPYPRTVVACGGHNIEFLNYRAAPPLDTFGWTTVPVLESPAAVGDVNGDGVSEAVVAGGNFVWAFDLYVASNLFSRNLGVDVSDAPTLADFDADGSAEIVVPTQDGRLWVLKGDGSDYGTGGWPFPGATGTPATSAAIANILGTGTPELIYAEQSWTLHVLYDDAAEQSGYPVEPATGWFIFGPPAVGRVEGYSGDATLGARDGKIYAFDNFGSTIPGWPKQTTITNQMELTPAMGDIDQDGRNEIVYAGPVDLIVVDVGEAPAVSSSTWPMYGGDAQRTGCWECAEDVTTAAPDAATRPTRISFRGAAPNPVSDTTTFAFAVPVRASAKLEIIDLLGRRICTVMREEVTAGEHLIGWTGRDDDGRPVPSGRYFARLNVRGPGLRNELTRGVTIVR